MTKPRIPPPIWLLAIIAGLPLISETIYTPSLPDIARTLDVPDSWVEYTLTIYLAGFAVGTLFWGKLSDRFGRKPCLLVGISIFIVGCMGCYLSDSITLLMISRFVQSFGGSTGSVLGQAICRDAFRGVERGKVYSTVGSALFFSPAIGPFIGGLVDQTFGWPSIFLLSMILGGMVFITTSLKLPESHLDRTSSVSFGKLTLALAKDIRVFGFGIIVAACNGIHFSYYAEGPFYLIDLLSLTPSTYGLSFIGIAFAGVMGSWISKRLHSRLSSKAILWRGIIVLLCGSGIFLSLILILQALNASQPVMVMATLGSMMIISGGSAMILPNCLSLALEDYQHAVGAASSLFGFFYYALISLVTLGIGLLHNDTLYPMPLYFFGMSVFVLVIFLKFIGKEERT